MRLILVGVLLALAAGVGPAWSQEPVQKQEDFNPEKINWLKKPTGRDFARNYPRDAADKEVSGGAVLCCVPREDGSVACKSIVHVPANFAFGDAAVKISHAFRMSASDAQAWRDRGDLVRIGISFRIDGYGPRVAEALARFDELTKEICKTPEAAALFTPAPGAVPTQDATH